MNCYYHPTQPAVGLCKHCQRGLCTDCAADVDGSLACKGHHEEQVRALEALTARNLLQAGRVEAEVSADQAACECGHDWSY